MTNRDLYKLPLKTGSYVFILASIVILITCKKIEREAKVETISISEITTNSAKAIGEIIDLGDGITDHGHCWSLSANPTIADSKILFGSVAKTGSFTSDLHGLIPGKIYHVRAYIVSRNEVFYGDNMTFTTSPVFISSVVEDATPTRLEMVYSSILADIKPAVSAFTVQINSAARTVNSVTISGTKVSLTLASAVLNGDVVTVSYTKPTVNPLQTVEGGQAATFISIPVTNNVNPINPVYVGSLIENVTPSILEMIFNLTLANIVPAVSAFSVNVNSVTRTVNSVSVSGTKVMLTLGNSVVNGDIVTVSYTKPALNPIQTSSGAQAATLSAQTVVNNVTPGTPPVYISSAIENTTPFTLEMTYSLPLANIVPAAAAFTVMVNFVARTVNSVDISGTKVILTLANAVVYGDIVTAGYTKPASNPLQTTSGSLAVSITFQAVTNNVLASIPLYVSSIVQGATPGVLEMTYDKALANILPATSAFIVMVNSVARSINTVDIYGTKVLLTLASPIVNGDIVTIAYTKPVNNPLQTVSGGQASTISAQSVILNFSGTTLVYINSAIENATPNTLVINYNLLLAIIIPSSSAFNVMVNSMPRTITAVSISGTQVRLTIASAVFYGDIVTVAYTKPINNPLQSAAGDQASTISGQPVSNKVLCTAPSATTNTATNIGTTTATFNGTVTANNYSTSVSFEYGTTISYGSSITATQSPLTGSSNIAVSAGVTGLSSNVLYHYRVKALNCGGTIYGTNQTFTSMPMVVPTLTTTAATSITSTTAVIGGNILSDGGDAITARGVCWATTSNPTIGNSKTNDGTGTGSFISNLTGLASGTTYYVRAFATNTAGTAYGSEVSFTTLSTGTTITDIDGNTYSTVTIGTQVWMAENLKTTKYSDGTNITYPGIDNTAWQNNINGAFSWYNNDEISNKNIYGALYNWFAVSNSHQLCPTGWHVPTNAEWTTLTTFLGGETIAGGKLKETGFMHWQNPNSGATNETGFTAIPGGFRASNNGTFSNITVTGFWWSSSEFNVNTAWYRYLSYSIGEVNGGDNGKSNGFSVRCIKD